MAQNPDPTVKLTCLTDDVTRTLDDWLTMFHLCAIVLPDRPEATQWLPVVRKIFRVFGDADCHTAVCIPGNEQIAHRILDNAVYEFMVFADTDREFVKSLGLQQLPAFVHLRQDTTLAAVAEGWQVKAWQEVADGLGKALAWSVPTVSGPGLPPETNGWPAATD